MSEVKDAANPPARPREPARIAPENQDGFDGTKLELHLQEYIQLRAEQRARLDSANKIIHYYAIMLAALIAGLLTVYKTGGGEAFNSVFPVALLIIPAVTVPFVFAQQNEEMIVRNIGDYFRTIKGRITSDEADESYWTWEQYHASKLTGVNIKSFSLGITAVFRAGLLLFFSAFSLVAYYLTYGWSAPWTFARYVLKHWGDDRQTIYMGALLCIDWMLILIASWIGVGMIQARVSLKDIVKTLYRRVWKKQTAPSDRTQEQ
jgi:hypothetical protein